MKLFRKREKKRKDEERRDEKRKKIGLEVSFEELSYLKFKRKNQHRKLKRWLER